MQEDQQKISPIAQSGGKFIDTLIGQWMKRTGSNILLHRTEEMLAESSNTQENKQIIQDQERKIRALQQKLKQCLEMETSLSASLEMEIHHREEIQAKLNATWESIDTITEYFNYISESLANFQQHRANLSSLYDKVIMKQQETIQNLQQSNVNSKNLKEQIKQLESKSLLQEERLQEAMAEQSKLQKQLESSTNELQLQNNELVKAHAQEKLTFVKEHQRLLLECEDLQSRLQTFEREKCDIMKLVTQLENKLTFREKKLQETLAEQSKLQNKLESSNKEYDLQKNNLMSVHIEEKKKLAEEQQQILRECESLQLRLDAVEKDKSNVIQIVVQKDALISKFQDENFIYKNEIETLKASSNEVYIKYEAAVENQKKVEEELRAKTERIHNLETILSVTKQRETRFLNDVNRIEKKLISQTDYSKDLENKLSDVQNKLQFTHMQNDEMQKNLENTKNFNELANAELQLKLKTLQKEKEEILKRESTMIKNTETLYENTQAKHAEEILALENSYKTRLLELKNTIDHLNDTISNMKKENSLLNMSLTQLKTDNNKLKNDFQYTMEYKQLQDKLKETMETSQTKSFENENLMKKPSKNRRQSKAKHEHTACFEAAVSEIPISETNQCNVSTSADVNDSKSNNKGTLSQLKRAYSIEKKSEQEQEAEVTSVGKKFFKTRPVQPRTYSRR